MINNPFNFKHIMNRIKGLCLLFLYLVFSTALHSEEYSNQIYCLGNSLTEGLGGNGKSYPSVLSELSGLNVINAGAASQTSTQIAGRFGAIPVTVSTYEDKIEANPEWWTSVIGKDIDILYHTSPKDIEVTGTICGIHGRMFLVNGGHWYFQRDDYGEIVYCPPGTEFILDPTGAENDIVLFWMGKNNTHEKQTILDDIDACIRRLTPGNNRFLVLSITTAPEYIGTLGYDAIIDINNTLKSIYPDNYVDVQNVLVNSFNPEIPRDVTDYMNGTIPYSLLSDPIHLNEKGYEIVAKTVYEELISKNWIKSTATSLSVQSNNEIIRVNNPVKSILTVTFPEASKQSSIEIVDLDGKKLLQQIVFPGMTSLNVNLEHFPKGMYFLNYGTAFVKVIKE